MAGSRPGAPSALGSGSLESLEAESLYSLTSPMVLREVQSFCNWRPRRCCSACLACQTLFVLLVVLCQPIVEAHSIVDGATSSSGAARTDALLGNSLPADQNSEFIASAQGHRRLGVIISDLPPNTRIRALLGSTGVWCQPPACTLMNNVYAGMNVLSLEISVGHLFHTFDTASNGRMRIVPAAISESDAKAGACKASFLGALGDASVSSPWDAQGSTVTYVGNPATIAKSNFNLRFLMGGFYRICYSHDGTFNAGHADVTMPNLYVQGVYDATQSCTNAGGNCLSQRKHYCYVLKYKYNNADNTYGSSTSCVVDLSYNGAGIEGNQGRGSWTAPFSVTYDPAVLTDTKSDTPVKVADVVPQECTTTPSYFLCPNGGHCGLGSYDVSLISQGKLRLPMPVARPDLGPQYFKPWTVAACYCPSYDGCNAFADYMQQVGILYYFVTKTCGHGDDGLACNPDYTGVAAPFRFAVRVECPGEACRTIADDKSKIKIVAKNDKNDLPSWDPNNNCFPAVHGLNTMGRLVLPLELNLDVAEMGGGPREDFKLWNVLHVAVNATTSTTTSTTTTRTTTTTTSTDAPTTTTTTNITTTTQKNATTISTTTSTTNTTITTTSTTSTTTVPPVIDTANETAGFVLHMGYNVHERVNFNFEETFDICYCNDLCGNPRNWFKAGEIRNTPIHLVSAASNTSVEANQLTVQYAGQPGILGFYRPPSTSNQLGMLEGGMVKIVEDSELDVDNEGCKNAIYSTTVTDTTIGLSSTSASTTYRGVASSDRIIFNNGDLANRITVKKPGFFAVCYCARTEGQLCFRNSWVLAVRLTIRGPTPNQHWMLSTHMTFRLSYAGFGLQEADKIRIVPPSTKCSDDNNNPNGATSLTGLKVQCPYPCVDIGSANQAINGDLGGDLLADNRFECDNLNSQCRQCDIKEVTVMNTTHTQIFFEFAPGLKEGDMLTLGDNIICKVGTACTEEQLATLKGRFNFADRNDNTPVAPDSYIVGHAVLATADKRKFIIKVGWPDPVPLFEVVEDPNNNFKRGRWTRHTRATTKEELMGIKQSYDMKVCWKSGGLLGSYIAQAGTLTMKDPSPMSNCLISMTSTVKRASSPIILSWRTSSADMVPRYSSVTGPTKLRILWTNTFAVNPRYVTGLPIKADSSADELKDAKQATCGSIFREMWSSDAEFGFPLPRGCYHSAFGVKREVFIVFDPKNGLRAGQDYQLVLNAVAEEQAKQGAVYAEIMAMDDVYEKPYEAIERGLASLKDKPQARAAGTKGVMFASGGFSMAQGDVSGLYELGMGKSWFFELRGEPIGGGISANSILRIFLWPLTMWNVDPECSAVCIPFSDAHPCGVVRGCTGEAVVPSFHRNYLKLLLPNVMSTATRLTYPTIRIDNIRLPPGGIFPLRFPAQISKTDDTKPHYVEGVGALMFKAPADGQTYARVVDVYGDGDQRPFRNSDGNTLYAQIVLGATLFAGVQTGDAAFVLTLPAGYECVRLQDKVEDDHRGLPVKISQWRAENNLTVFGTKIPQGRGTPDEGTGTRGWSVDANKCTFTLTQMSVVYAYASLYIRITVNNPPQSMKRETLSNKWSLTLKGKGLHQQFVEFPAVTFKGSPPNYAANVAVLGRMDAASIVPLNFVQPRCDAYAPVCAVKPSEIYVFFATEQHNNVLGFIRVVSPIGFEFDTGPNGACVAKDLPDSYYGLRRPGLDTYRLPGNVACKYGTTPVNHAEIKLEGMLQSGSWYAFSLGVRILVGDTVPYTAAQQEEWKLFTLTKLNYRVDGTPAPVRLTTRPLSLTGGARWGKYGAPDANKSWGIYRRELEGVNVLISSLRSYTLTCLQTCQRAWVQVRPLRLPFVANTTLRVLAPEGFLWDFADAEFKYTPGAVSCITHPLPGGVPERAGNMLLWSTSAVYKAKPATYGFATYVRVPVHSPTSSINAFIIQLGFDSNSSSGRIAAATVPLQPDPGTSNTEVTDSHVVFQLSTQTVQSGGALVIFGPAPNEFIVKSICTADLSPASAALGCAKTGAYMPRMLPADVKCNSTLSTANGLVIQIVAGPSKILEGTYRFQLKINKSEARRMSSHAPRPNMLKLSSPCLLQQCWKVKVVKDVANLTWMVSREFTLMGPMSLLNKLRSSSEVSALADANAEYSTNVIGAPNNLTLTLRTVSSIPEGGAIQITGPEGFDIEASCAVEEPSGVRGSPYYVWSSKNTRSVLPNDVTCASYPTDGYTTRTEVVPGKVTIILRAGASGILPQLYRFQIKVKNPKEPQTNPVKLSTLCGFRFCWSFKTLEDISVRPNASQVQLDVPTSTAGFWINRALVDARMVELTWPQILASGQDRRPLHTNPIIFAFMLKRSAVYPATFKVRAPLGYVFREECLSDVETNATKVFNTEVPQEYTHWDQGVKVTSCWGDGPDAKFFVDPGTTKGLQENQLIVFRISVLYNAPEHPVDNRWSLDYAQESSLPLEGFQLWTFKRTSLHGVTWARSSAIPGVDSLRNAVTFTFRPYYTVRGRGMKIKVTAPPHYKMVNSKLECQIIVQKMDLDRTTGDKPPPMNFTDVSSLLSPAFVRWGESDIYCRVDASDSRKLTATTVVDTRELLSGHDYQVTVFVTNPTIFPPWRPDGLGITQAAEYPWTLTPSMWRVETEASPNDPAPHFRDLHSYPEKPVIQRMLRWSVINFNEQTEAQDIVGKALVPNVQFFIMFTDQPNAEDSLYIEAPLGFNLSSNPTVPGWSEAISPRPTEPVSDWVQCNNLKWKPVSMEYASKANVTCNGRRMLIKLFDADFSTVLRNGSKGAHRNAPPLSFTMDVVNAVKTPHVTVNHWICCHRDSDNHTRAEAALHGWPLRSQLENVMLKLIGKNQAEQATSTIEIYFTPVSDAGELRLEAKLPVKGWSFAEAVAVSLGHEVIPEVRNTETENRNVRITCVLFAGLPVVIQLTGVKLGYWGGTTEFNLITTLANGLQKDERLGFIDGFRLPGRIAVADQYLKNQFQQDAAVHPVPSLWPTRMTEAAVASFTITLTQDAPRGTALRIRAPPYTFQTAMIGNIQVIQESAGYGEVVLRLNESMPSWNLTTSEYQMYVVTAEVLTPAMPLSTDAMWRFDILDTDILPVNTNDALTEGFALVAPIIFSVFAARSPPMAEIQVEVSIDPKGTFATQFLMVAPIGYIFTDNCLHDGGKSEQILSCRRTNPVANRGAAMLTVAEPGLLAPITDLVIKIVCPRKPQSELSWYLQARSAKFATELGWGEDTKGIVVKPMPEYGVIYSGVANKVTPMVFFFKSTIRLAAGGKIQVSYPEGVQINCAGPSFNKISLRGEAWCDDYPDAMYFVLGMPDYMSPGWQAFAVTATAPETLFNGTNFSILCYEPPSEGGKVIDGVTTVAGKKPRRDIDVEALPFHYGASSPLATTRVSLGFELKTKLPAKGGPTVSSLLFRMPPQVSHQISRLSQITISSPASLTFKKDPADPNNVDFALDRFNPEYLIVKFNEQAAKPHLHPGEYRFEFPVLVPTVLPAKNVWVLTICQMGTGVHVNTTDCLDENSPNAITSFPFIGFTMGAPPNGMRVSVAGTIQAFGFEGFWIAFIFMLAMTPER